MFTDIIHIKPTAPFNFDLSATIFNNGDKQIRTFQNGIFNQVIRVDGNLTFARVTSEGKVDTPKLTVTLTSQTELNELEKEKAKKTIIQPFTLL
jgi:DNA-3-methyladenine glycosylase II